MPGTNIDAPGVRSHEPEPTLVAMPNLRTDVCLMCGVTERGRFGAFTTTSFTDWVNEYGGITAESFDAYISAWGYFENGGSNLVTVRVTHYTDLTDPATRASAAATIAVTSAATETYGTVTTGNTEPFRLDPGDTLVFAVDGGGDETATYDAAQAGVQSSGCNPTGFTGGETLTFKVDGGVLQTITFLAGDITVALAAQRINNLIESGRAEVVSAGAEIKIWSDTYGGDSSVEIVGGTDYATLGFSIGTTNGTGDVADIRAVTAAELKARVVADCASLSDTEVVISGGAVSFSSPTIGATGSIQCKSSSTADGDGAAEKCYLDNTVHSGSAAGSGTTGTVDAKSDGAWANGWQFDVSNAENGDATYFNVSLLDVNGIEKGSWKNCITTTTDPDYVEDKINLDAENHYITYTDSESGSAPGNRPTNGTYTLAAGDSGLTLLADTDFVGNSAGPTGLYEFDTTANARTLIVPGKASSTIHNGMITYCDTWRNKEIVCIMDSPEGYSDTQIRTYFVTTALLKGASEMATMIWPRGHLQNPRPAVLPSDDTVKNNIKVVNVPLSGFWAGGFARNDAAPGGVYQPPAGSTLTLRGLLGVEIISAGQEKHPVEDARKRANVYADRINCVRPATGGVWVDGTKMSKADGNFNTIGARRGASHIKLTLEEGLAGEVHRNIRPSLLRKIRRSSRNWLNLQTRNGAFVTDDPDQAYSLICDGSNNPGATQMQGKINVSLGVAFAFPADFIDIGLYRDYRSFEADLARG